VTGALTEEQVEGFVRDGFVYLPSAFPRSLADECRAFLWAETGPHRGTVPRFMAQPPLQPAVPLDIAAGRSPVERAIRLGLADGAPGGGI
jgi:hypothetical protein